MGKKEKKRDIVYGVNPHNRDYLFLWGVICRMNLNFLHVSSFIGENANSILVMNWNLRCDL